MNKLTKKIKESRKKRFKRKLKMALAKREQILLINTKINKQNKKTNKK